MVDINANRIVVEAEVEPAPTSGGTPVSAAKPTSANRGGLTYALEPTPADAGTSSKDLRCGAVKQLHAWSGEASPDAGGTMDPGRSRPRSATRGNPPDPVGDS